MSFNALGMLVLFLEQPYFELPWFPQADRMAPQMQGNSINPFNTGNVVLDKLLFNHLLIIAFWLQHSIMARPGFKRLMNSPMITKNHYHFYEKGMYALLAGIMVLFVIYLHEPITEVMILPPIKP